MVAWFCECGSSVSTSFWAAQRSVTARRRPVRGRPASPRSAGRSRARRVFRRHAARRRTRSSASVSHPLVETGAGRITSWSDCCHPESNRRPAGRPVRGSVPATFVGDDRVTGSVGANARSSVGFLPVGRIGLRRRTRRRPVRQLDLGHQDPAASGSARRGRPRHRRSRTLAASSPAWSAIAWARLEARRTPGGNGADPRVITTICRPGRIRPIDSQVLRPISSVCPIVVRRKCARSSGRCHGRRLSRPIAPLRARATIMVSRGIGPDPAASTAIGALIAGCDA